MGKAFSNPTQLAWQRFLRHKLAWYSLMGLAVITVLVVVAPFLLEFFLGVDYRSVDLDRRFQAPQWPYLFGTDELGRDVLSRLFYGGRISIAVAIFSAGASLIIGTTIGAISGYYGGVIDSFLMRFTDAMMSLPTLPLMIILAAVDLTKVMPDSLLFLIEGNYGSLFKLMIIIVFFGWMTVARLVRGEFLSLREREFIQASRAVGVGNQKIIWVHMLPNCVAPIIVAITLSIGSIILYEAILSFIGLGIQPPIPSWGNMLHHALDYIRTAPLLAIYPGVFILTTVVCINFVGDGLRDAFDPKFTLR